MSPGQGLEMGAEVCGAHRKGNNFERWKGLGSPWDFTKKSEQMLKWGRSKGGGQCKNGPLVNVPWRPPAHCFISPRQLSLVSNGLMYISCKSPFLFKWCSSLTSHLDPQAVRILPCSKEREREDKKKRGIQRKGNKRKGKRKEA